MAAVTNVFEIAQAIATVIAIIVGGYWTYMLFVKRRIDFPRANIAHQVTHRVVSNDKSLLHVDVTISNVGDTLLQLTSGEVRIQQIVPAPPSVLNAISANGDPVAEGNREVDWPLVASRKTPLEIEIEPGERDELHYDLFVDADIETVVVYSYFENVRKIGRNIGWAHTTIYDLMTSVSPT